MKRKGDNMFLDTKNKSIRFTGRWDTAGNNAVTTAPGGMIEIAYRGRAAVLKFDTGMNMHPYPHLWIQVDDGAKVETTVDRVIRIEAPQDGYHVIKVIYKSAVEVQHRWYAPLIGKLNFEGAEVYGEGAELPEDNRKIIEFIGDSITEGVLIDEFYHFDQTDQFNRPVQDDSTATYAYLTAEALGMKPVIMGYGAVGVTHGGCGSVPKAADAYPYNFAGSKAKAQGSDIIVINHGANDAWGSEEAYITEYEGLLKEVRGINPKSEIVVLSAFYGVYPDALKELVERFNKENGDNIGFIDSKGWIPKEPLHPLRDGHKTIAEKLTAELKKMFNL